MSKVYLPTTETAVIEDYPYGRLKCTMTKVLEFDKKKGFRVVSQTTNPKTGRLNAPKKSTYSALIVLTNTDGFISSAHFDFNGAEAINKGTKFVNENFHLFTPEQIQYLYSVCFNMLKLEAYAMVKWCGADVDKVLPALKLPTEAAVKGLKEAGNQFADILVDIEAMEQLKDKEFKPFAIKETFVIG